MTSGRSLDVARAYIEATGASALLFAWLKTITAAFSHMSQDPPLTPFTPYASDKELSFTSYGYSSHIVDSAAPAELDAILTAYKGWPWP